jgi:hypothetical protein
MEILETLKMAWWLLCAHGLGDMAWQHPWIATHKYEYIDGTYNKYWFATLSAHSIICGFCVSVATGIWWLGPLEALWHWVTDYLSTHKKISFFWDQVSHLTAKVVWLMVWCVIK